MRHLQNQHNDVFLAVKTDVNRSENQPSILKFSKPNVKKLSRGDHKQKRFDSAILAFLASNRASFQVLNTNEFKEIIRIADPSLTVKSRQSMLSKLSKLVQAEIVPKLRTELNDIEEATISFDLWTSHRKDGVLAIKLFYLDKDFNLRRKTISILEVNEKHEGTHICDLISKALQDYKIRHKIKYIVTDNGANVISAMKEFKKLSEESWDTEIATRNQPSSARQEFETIEDISSDVDSDSYEESNHDSNDEVSDIEGGYDSEINWEIDGVDESAKLLNDVLHHVDPEKERISCIAHTLQLVVKNALKNEMAGKEVGCKSRKKVAKLMGKGAQLIAFVNKIVKFFQNSSLWLARLRKSGGKGLVKHAETRWNYIYDVLSRLIEDPIFEAVQHLLYKAMTEAKYAYEKKRHPGLLTLEHKQQMQELISVIKPMCVMTDVLQSDGVTSSLIIPQVYQAFI
ncbi:unnamed protein product, partial [Allacma fusca]